MQVRNILITGASGGLGSALARTYARAGTTLILWGRDAQRLGETASKCRALGAETQTDQFDLRDSGGLIARLVALDTRHPVDLAIFNAGLGGTVPENRLAEAPQAALAMAEVNFVAPVVGASAIAEEMARRRGGHIVLIGS